MLTVLPGYRTDVLVVALGALLVGQLLPRILHWWALLFCGLISVGLLVFTGEVLEPQPDWFAVAPLTGEVFDPSQYLNWEKISWASFAVSLVTILVFALALPHSPTPAWSFTLQVPLGVGITSALVFLGSSQLAVLAILFLVFLGSSLSGRDLTARPLGRLAAAAFLIPVLAGSCNAELFDLPAVWRSASSKNSAAHSFPGYQLWLLRRLPVGYLARTCDSHSIRRSAVAATFGSKQHLHNA
jgi:hypothetical protein